MAIMSRAVPERHDDASEDDERPASPADATAESDADAEGRPALSADDLVRFDPHWCLFWGRMVLSSQLDVWFPYLARSRHRFVVMGTTGVRAPDRERLAALPNVLRPRQLRARARLAWAVQALRGLPLRQHRAGELGQHQSAATQVAHLHRPRGERQGRQRQPHGIDLRRDLRRRLRRRAALSTSHPPLGRERRPGHRGPRRRRHPQGPAAGAVQGAHDPLRADLGVQARGRRLHLARR